MYRRYSNQWLSRHNEFCRPFLCLAIALVSPAGMLLTLVQFRSKYRTLRFIVQSTICSLQIANIRKNSFRHTVQLLSIFFSERNASALIPAPSNGSPRFLTSQPESSLQPSRHGNHSLFHSKPRLYFSISTTQLWTNLSLISTHCSPATSQKSLTLSSFTSNLSTNIFSTAPPTWPGTLLSSYYAPTTPESYTKKASATIIAAHIVDPSYPDVFFYFTKIYQFRFIAILAFFAVSSRIVTCRNRNFYLSNAVLRATLAFESNIYIAHATPAVKLVASNTKIVFDALKTIYTTGWVEIKPPAFISVLTTPLWLPALLRFCTSAPWHHQTPTVT